MLSNRLLRFSMACFSASSFIASIPSEASELIFTPSVSSGVTYLHYKQRAGFFPKSANTFGEYEVSGALPFIGGGLQMDYSPFYVSIAGHHTFKAEDSDDLIITRPPFGQQVSLQSDFKRADVSLIAGYLINREFSLFAGYKYAKADIENDVSSKSDVPGFIGIQVDGALDVDVTYQGPTVGFAYDLAVGSLGGSLTFSSDISYLLADITQEFTPAPGSEQGGLAGDADGRSLGYNLTLGWRGEVISKLYYMVIANTSWSDFDMDENVSDFTETEYRLRLGLMYQFDGL
jgi:hypothetical protein